MVFADLFFLYFFLPVCLIAYFVAKDLKTKNMVLIAFSLLFYAWGEPVYVLMLVFSSVMNWYVGLLIERFRDTKAATASLTAGSGEMSVPGANIFLPIENLIPLYKKSMIKCAVKWLKC